MRRDTGRPTATATSMPVSRHTHTRAHIHVHKSFTSEFLSVSCAAPTHHPFFIMTLRPLAESSLPFLQTITVNTRFLLELLTLTVHVRERGSHWKPQSLTPLHVFFRIFTLFQEAMKTSHSEGSQWPACYHFTAYFPDSRAEAVHLLIVSWHRFAKWWTAHAIFECFYGFLIPSVARQYVLRFILEWNNAPGTTVGFISIFIKNIQTVVQ